MTREEGLVSETPHTFSHITPEAFVFHPFEKNLIGDGDDGSVAFSFRFQRVVSIGLTIEQDDVVGFLMSDVLLPSTMHQYMII